MKQILFHLRSSQKQVWSKSFYFHSNHLLTHARIPHDLSYQSCFYRNTCKVIQIQQVRVHVHSSSFPTRILFFQVSCRQWDPFFSRWFQVDGLHRFLSWSVSQEFLTELDLVFLFRLQTLDSHLDCFLIPSKPWKRRTLHNLSILTHLYHTCWRVQVPHYPWMCIHMKSILLWTQEQRELHCHSNHNVWTLSLQSYPHHQLHEFIAWFSQR